MLFIVNPKAGRGRAERVLSRVWLEAEGLEPDVQRTRYPGHALELVRKSTLGAEDTVVVIGGDGTIHEVVNAMMERGRAKRPALGLLPGGSGNSLAHDLRVVDVERALAVLLEGHHSSMDLLRLRLPNRILYAFNMVGWGLPATTGARAEAFRWLGPNRYNIASIIEIILDRTQKVALETEGNRRCGAFPAVIACNTQHVGSGMRMAPRARLDDGLMDLVVLESASRLQTLGLLRRVYDGSHVETRNVSYIHTKRCLLEADTQGLLNVDGELVQTDRFEIEVVPGAIDVIGL